MARLTPSINGVLDMAYRFSTDNGKTWLYVDTDEANPAYETGKAINTATAPTIIVVLVRIIYNLQSVCPWLFSRLQPRDRTMHGGLCLFHYVK